MITDIYYEHLLIWRRRNIEWNLLCTHLPLTKGIRGDVEAMEEELEHMAAMRGDRSVNHRIREREKDLAAISSSSHFAKACLVEEERI